MNTKSKVKLNEDIQTRFEDISETVREQLENIKENYEAIDGDTRKKILKGVVAASALIASVFVIKKIKDINK